MTDDEAAIRKLVDTWMRATENGDIATILTLMTDDVVFMVPGREPFGREAFASAADGNSGTKVEAANELVELQVLDGWAFARSRLEVKMTPAEGEPMSRSGYALTLFRKERDGRWRLARDANLLAGDD